MDSRYEEVKFLGNRPSPWKVNSLLGFADVTERKFDSCHSAKNDVGDPPTPPPSPMGVFKYPALLRGSNSWSKTPSVSEVIAKLCRSEHEKPIESLATIRHHEDDKKEFETARRATLQNFLTDLKPAKGKRKMYLWRVSKGIDCPKLDPNSLTKRAPSRSLKFSASKVESVAKVSAISMAKKSKTFLKAQRDKKNKDVSVTSVTMLHSLNNYSDSTTSTKEFDVVLKHALSHDPVISKHNLTPRIQRSMIFA